MKKRIFSMLLATLFLGSVGVGVLAGCDDENPGGDGNGTEQGGGTQQGGGAQQGTGNGSGTSVATDPIEGVWSGASLDDGLFWMSGDTTDSFTATVDLFDDALHDGYVVVKATETNGTDSWDFYIAMGVDKEEDTYKGTFVVDDPTDPYSFTAKIENNQLIAEVTYHTWFSEDVTKTLTFTTKSDFPAAIEPTGTLYPDNAFLPYGFDFAAKTMTVDGQTIPAHVYHIGEYISVMTTMGSQTIVGAFADVGFTVYKKGTDYYAYSVITAYAMDEEDGIALVTEAPAFSVTVNFELGENAATDAVKPQSVTLTSPTQKFTLPAAPAAKDGYKFSGWKKYDSSYADPVGSVGAEVSLLEAGLFTAPVTLYACYDAIEYSVQLDDGECPLSQDTWSEIKNSVGGYYGEKGTLTIGLSERMNEVYFPVGIYYNEVSEKTYRLTGWKLADTDTTIAPTAGESVVQFVLTSEIFAQLNLKEGDAITFTALWSEVTD